MRLYSVKLMRSVFNLPLFLLQVLKILSVLFFLWLQIEINTKSTHLVGPRG